VKKQDYIKTLLIILILTAGISTSFAKKSKKKNAKETQETGNKPLTKKDLEEQAIFIAGMQAYLLGNDEDAIGKFNDVLRRDLKNDAAYYMLSKIAFETGNMDKSIEFAQNAVKINPYNEYYYQYLAEAKGEKQDFSGAAKTYENLVKLQPKVYDYYYDWAFMLAKAEKYKEAIDVYNMLEEKTGISEELIFQKQPLFIKLGKIEECVKDIEKLIQLYPAETRYIGLVGEVYMSNKMYDKAIDAFNRILKIEPNNADALLALAQAYRKTGNEKKHDELIQRVFNNKDIDIDAKIYTIIPYIEKLAKDSTIREEVLKMADMIVTAHPNNVKATTARADVLYNIGKKKEAQAEYEKAISFGEDIPNTVWIQSYILDAELEDYDHLIAITKKGIIKNPKEVFGYFYNAVANQQKKNYKDAADILDKAFDLQQKNKDDIAKFSSQLKLQMLIALGDVNFELKNFERCDSAYEAALEIDPNNATVLNNYAYYLSERDDKLEKAERMSKKSNLLVEGNSAFIDTYAWIMYKMKNYTEALSWMEQAMILIDSQERPDLLIHYGDILSKTGQEAKAVEQWQKAIQKGGDRAALELKIKNPKLIK
jgi:tetratricopeptide (TPR) repeat protein